MSINDEDSLETEPILVWIDGRTALTLILDTTLLFGLLET